MLSQWIVTEPVKRYLWIITHVCMCEAFLATPIRKKLWRQG